MGVGIAVAEGSLSSEKFINQDAKTIEIELVGVALVVIDFRGHRVDSTADGKGSVLVDLFSVTEVDHGDFAFVIDHEIGSFDIPIDKTVVVELLKDESDL